MRPPLASFQQNTDLALLRELSLRGVSAKAYVPFPLCYKGQLVGEYIADLVVLEDCASRFRLDLQPREPEERN
jgi:hypothetical protein